MAHNHNNRLDGWKEIARYLGRDESTAIRWHHDRGLPVRHVPGGGRKAVFAYTTEIDAWLTGHSEVPASGEGNLREPSNRIESAEEKEGLGRTHVPAASRWKRWVWAVLSVALLLAAALSAWVWKSWPRAADHVTFGANKLMAWDQNGRLAWTYEFEKPLRELSPFDPQARTLRADLDGDGRQEVVVVAAYDTTGKDEQPGSEVFCFSASGNLLWRYEPELELTFHGRTFRKPWAFGAMLAVPEKNGTHSVWITFLDHIWWPCFLVRLDDHGTAKLEFVNSGWIFALNYTQTPDGLYVLAGGTNNEYDASALAVIRAGNAPSSSPQQTEGEYACDSCSAARPFRYFVFPRSELNSIEGAYRPDVSAIGTDPTRLTVWTLEFPQLLPPDNGLRGLYTLSEKFELLSAQRADQYWRYHRKLELQGRVKHPAEACPERIGPILIRMWTAEKGWEWVEANTQPAKP